jgi:hypothetical protein
LFNLTIWIIWKSRFQRFVSARRALLLLSKTLLLSSAVFLSLHWNARFALLVQDLLV